MDGHTCRQGVVFFILGLLVAGCGTGPSDGVESDRAVPDVDYRSTRMDVSRTSMPAVGLGDTVYVIGGTSANGQRRDILAINRDLNSMSVVDTGLSPRFFHTAAVADSRIYIAGGYRDGQYLDTLEIYNPSTDTLEEGPPMPTPRYLATAVEYDGKIYVIGGAELVDGQKEPSDAVEVYDPGTGEWERRAPLPTPRLTEAVVYKDTILAVSGFDYSSGIRAVEQYHPDEDRWSDLPPLPHDVSAYRATVLGDTVYTFGDFEWLDFMGAYNPETGNFRTLFAPDLQPTRHNAMARLGQEVFLVGGNMASRGARSDRVQKINLAGAVRLDRWARVPFEAMEDPSRWFASAVESASSDDSTSDGSTTSGSSYGGHSDWVGEQLPGQSFVTLQGENRTLRDWDGPKLVNFWATWCGPCIEEIPALNRIQDNYGDRMTVVGVGYEDTGTIDDFLEDHEIDYPLVRKDQSELKSYFGEIAAYPTTMLVNRNLEIEHVVVGSRNYDQWERLVKKHLIEGASSDGS